MNNFFKKKKIYLFELLFIIIISFVPLLWFLPGHVVLGLDSGYPVNHKLYLDQRIYTWLASENFGIDMTSETGGLLYNLFPAFIQTSGISSFDVQKILFVFWFFAVAVSMYALITYLFPQKGRWVIRLLAVVIYTFNFHLYPFWLQGEQAILASYVLLPLLTLFLLRFIEKKTNAVRAAAYLSLTYVFFSADGFRGIPLIGPVIVTGIVLLLYYFLFAFKKEGFEYVKRCGIFAFWFAIFSIFCNAYFLLPFLSSFALQYQKQVNTIGGIENAIQWTQAISVYDSFINLFRLQGDNSWYNNPISWAYPFLTNALLVFVSFLFPIFAFLAPLFAKEKREKNIVLFFTLLALIGVFLSAGAHPPLGDIYILLMKKVPGFAAYRSGYYKFMPLVYFSFAILIGFSVYYLLNKFSSKIKYIGYVAFILLILLYHYPFFTNSNFVFDKPFTTMIAVPSYVNSFAQMKNNSSDDYRSLVVPQTKVSNIKTYNWGYFAGYPLFPLITNKGFIQNDSFYYSDGDNDIINALYESLRQSRISAFLNLAKSTDVKYILVTSDVSRNYYLSLIENPAIYLSVLNKHKDTFKLVWENGPWYYYEIKGITPNKMQAYPSVAVKEGDPTSLDAILHSGILPFTTVDQTTSSLPINGTYTELQCVTCAIPEDNQDVNLSISKSLINPTSFLYPYKIKLEQRHSNQDLGNNLGLSLKRISELSTITDTTMKSPDQWVFASDLLKNNWMIINSQYAQQRNTENYFIQKELLLYEDFEDSQITKIIKYENITNSSNLGKSLIAADAEINRYKNELNKILDKNYWTNNNNFTYDISSASGQIAINPSSLQDAAGNVLLPTSYTIDGKTYPYTNPDTQKPTIDINKKASKLTLSFQLPNLFTHQSTEIETVNKEKQKCLVQSIPFYSGTNQYLINGAINKNRTGTVFIRRFFDSLNTPNSALARDDTTSFTRILYDLPYDPYNDTYSSTNILSGVVNDTAAKVYFCTPQLNDQNNAFSKMSVTQIITPELYSYNKNKKITTSAPSVSYHEINPTQYVITIRNAKSPYMLSFSDRFSGLWELYSGKEKISSHFMINGYANAWTIDKKGNYQLSLIFSTQKIFQYGYVISVISVSILLLYAIVRVLGIIKNEKNKK